MFKKLKQRFDMASKGAGQIRSGVMALTGGVALGMAPSAAHAATLKMQLTGLICSVAGNSSITLFAGAAAVIGFLILFLTGESSGNISTILKIAIGISGLVALPALVNAIAPGLLNCVTTGTF